MSHKGIYAEYTKTFPHMMQEFRAQPPEVEGCEGSVAFLLENEIRIIEKARYFAGRGRGADAKTQLVTAIAALPVADDDDE